VLVGRLTARCYGVLDLAAGAREQSEGGGSPHRGSHKAAERQRWGGNDGLKQRWVGARLRCV
jgi:hypothetical protein